MRCQIDCFANQRIVYSWQAQLGAEFPSLAHWVAVCRYRHRSMRHRCKIFAISVGKSERSTTRVLFRKVVAISRLTRVARPPEVQDWDLQNVSSRVVSSDSRGDCTVRWRGSLPRLKLGELGENEILVVRSEKWKRGRMVAMYRT